MLCDDTYYICFVMIHTTFALYFKEQHIEFFHLRLYDMCFGGTCNCCNDNANAIHVPNPNPNPKPYPKSETQS